MLRMFSPTDIRDNAYGKDFSYAWDSEVDIYSVDSNHFKWYSTESVDDNRI